MNPVPHQSARLSRKAFIYPPIASGGVSPAWGVQFVAVMLIRPVTHERFVAEVQRMTALDSGAAERACTATLEVVGQRLGNREAEVVAAALPPPLADALTRCDYDEPFGFAELAHRVARATGAELERAREQAQAVCEVLGQCVDDDGRQHLEHLPVELALLFRPRAHHQRVDPARLPHHGAAPAPDGTLARARGRHDLATGPAPEPEPERQIASSHGGRDVATGGDGRQ